MSKESAFEVGRLYLPIKTIADTLTASQKDVFVRLPALVGYWPMGMRAAGNVIEHSGSGFNLTQTGICPVGYDGNAYTHLGNGTNYVSNSSAQLGLSGLETWVSSSIRGMTVGGWFQIDSVPSFSSGLVSKSGLVTNYGYTLFWFPAGTPAFEISGNGSSLFNVAGPAIGTGSWHFLVGRFIPSNEIAVFQNGDKTTFTTAIPASMNASTQAYEMGRTKANDAQIIHGKARDVFICAAALSDALIEEIRASSVP